eukprot:g1428.t1
MSGLMDADNAYDFDEAQFLAPTDGARRERSTSEGGTSSQSESPSAPRSTFGTTSSGSEISESTSERARVWNEIWDKANETEREGIWHVIMRAGDPRNMQKKQKFEALKRYDCPRITTVGEMARKGRTDPYLYLSSPDGARRERSTSDDMYYFPQEGVQSGTSSARGVLGSTSSGSVVSELRSKRAQNFKKIWEQATEQEREAIWDILRRAGDPRNMHMKARFNFLKRNVSILEKLQIEEIYKRNQPQMEQPVSTSTGGSQRSGSLATSSASDSQGLMPPPSQRPPQSPKSSKKPSLAPPEIRERQEVDRANETKIIGKSEEEEQVRSVNDHDTETEILVHKKKWLDSLEKRQNAKYEKNQKYEDTSKKRRASGSGSDEKELKKKRS